MDEIVVVAEQHGVAEGDCDLLQVEGASLLRDSKALSGDGDFAERHEAYDRDQKQPRPRKSAETGCGACNEDGDTCHHRVTMSCSIGARIASKLFCPRNETAYLSIPCY